MIEAVKTSVIVRPPWPNEMSRIKQFLSGSLGGAEAVHLLVLVVPDPERIVGAAAIKVKAYEEEGRSAEIALGARPRSLQNGDARVLMEAVMGKVAPLACSTVYSSPYTGAPHIPLLREYGFELIKTEELWELEIRKLIARLDRLKERVRLPQDWIVRVPTSSDLPQLVKLSAIYEFRQAARVQFDGPKDLPGTHYDSKLCTVIEQRGSIIAALLIKGGTTCNLHVDVRLVRPEARHKSGMLNLHLLNHSKKAALTEGYSTATLTVNTPRDGETRNLALRTGGRCIQSKDLLHRR